MVPFNKPLFTGHESVYIEEALLSGKIAGLGPFSEKCSRWLEGYFGGGRCFMTTSCTAALEMAALLCDLEPGDEVILPSYAFPTTGSAFVRCGARLVYVDVDPATMSIDPQAVRDAVTERTRVLVVLHYGGSSCDMSTLCAIAHENDLLVVEDAAQALGASYEGRPCGSLGTFGCISFHESKNVHCGEGGALICNDDSYVGRAEVVLEKGTNRQDFFRGDVDRYTWLAVGSSYVMSDLNAAFLLAQLEFLDEVTADRRRSWFEYAERLAGIAQECRPEFAILPDNSAHNGHAFWIKLANARTRMALIRHLRARDVGSVFHYQPLHLSPAGRRHGRFHGKDRVTSRDADRLLRLPMFYGFEQAELVCESVAEFACDTRVT